MNPLSNPFEHGLSLPNSRAKFPAVPIPSVAVPIPPVAVLIPPVAFAHPHSLALAGALPRKREVPPTRHSRLRRDRVAAAGLFARALIAFLVGFTTATWRYTVSTS
jgi:hypothetical protein